MTVSALSLVVIAGLAGACPPLADPNAWWCPQAYQVMGEADPDQAWNVLFVSDGFREDELDTYRCAVHRLMGEVLESSLFRQHACHINVYRIDLASEPGSAMIETHPNCTLTCPEPVRVDPKSWKCEKEEIAAPAVGPADAPACATADIDASICNPVPSRCDMLWPDAEGQLRALMLTWCLPAVNAVVVVANTQKYAGAAVSGQLPALAVVTLADMDSPYRWRLLAHELGHSLFFLLDEYESTAATQSFTSRINIVTKADIEAGEIPWAELRTSPEDHCNVPDCCDEDPDPPEGYVGLIEGAFYHPCEYWRAQSKCRMRSTTDEYCEACGHFVKRLEGAFGLQGCEAAP